MSEDRQEPRQSLRHSRRQASREASPGPESRRRQPFASGAILTFVRLMLLAAAIPFVTGRLGGRLGTGLLEALCSPWVFQVGVVFVVCSLVFGVLHAWRRTNPLVDLGAALTLALWAAVVFVTPLRPVRDVEDAAAAGTRPFRVVHANLYVSARPTSEAVAWFDSLDADVIVFEELSPAWAEALAPLRSAAAASVWHPESGASGIGLLSRHPLLESTLRDREPGAFPAIDALVDLGDRFVRLLAIHPIPPMNRAAAAGRNAALASVAEKVAGLRDGEHVPVVVIGDLNETPWGSAMRSFLATSGLHSARRGFGRQPTWPAQLPSWGEGVPRAMMIPIDHCLVSPEIRVRNFRSGPAIGSDHLPIIADLELPSRTDTAAERERVRGATRP